MVTGRRDTETVERCEGFGAFYAKKGPEFWGSLEAALAELFPEMADDIRKVGSQSASVEMKTRSRVLVVDTDPEYGTFLSSRLAKQGVDMLYAADAQQGLRIASRDRPSVIIAEYSMPNGDARYLLGKLRANSATASIAKHLFGLGREIMLAHHVAVAVECGLPRYENDPARADFDHLRIAGRRAEFGRIAADD